MHLPIYMVLHLVLQKNLRVLGEIQKLGHLLASKNYNFWPRTTFFMTFSKSDRNTSPPAGFYTLYNIKTFNFGVKIGN